jgi:hypothetical protein
MHNGKTTATWNLQVFGLMTIAGEPLKLGK